VSAVRRAALLSCLALAGCEARSARPSLDAGDAAGTASSTVASDPRRVTFRSHFAMGSQLTITAYVDDEPAAVRAFAAVFAEFDRLEALLSTWRPASDISRINAEAGRGAVRVAPETLLAVTRGLELCRLTRGKFDITFGALSGLWRFDHDRDDRIPPAAEVKRRLPLVDCRRVEVDPQASTVRLPRAGMKLHLGGLGKGFAVDRGVALLRAAGLTDFMVQAGGDLYVAGRKGARPWRVGIRDPRGGPSSYFAAAEITDATFSTSGDYERAFLKDGVRYHHILDPATGNPGRGVRSVTVSTLDATTAEGLSKGAFLLGPEAGLALADSIPGAAVVIVDDRNEVHVSSRLRDKLKLLRAPTDAP
jgi:thiamine biosynthesis lipoprotein